MLDAVRLVTAEKPITLGVHARSEDLARARDRSKLDEWEANMQIRIEFPFAANFEFPDPGNNSREMRTQALQVFLSTCGMELGNSVEAFNVVSFHGEDNGEFWTVKVGTR